MKPKERYLNYALLTPANCDPNQSAFKVKEDIPIDLSTKRPPPHSPNFGLFRGYPDHPPFQSPPHGHEWPAKYCFPNLMAKQYGYSPAILPYLFINPNCLPGHEIERKHEDVLYEQFALPYRLPQDGLIFPFKLDHYGHPMYRHQERHCQSDRPLHSSESSSASSAASSPYDHHEYPTPVQQPHEYRQETSRRNLRLAPPSVSEHISSSTKGSQVVLSKAKLRKSFSFPNLLMPKRGNQSSEKPNLCRFKSEHNLHLIKSYSGSNKICAPKKMFASNYYQNMKENGKECKENSNKDKDTVSRSNNGTPTRFYRNYRKEVIECWDNENKDNERVQSEDALDLRMTNPLHKLPNGVEKQKGHSPNGYEKMSAYPSSEPLELKHPPALSMDIYRQYYYYLIQEPAFASRAAVAVAETYAKLMHSNKVDEGNGHFFPKSSSSPVDKFDNSPPHESKRASPDFVVSRSRAELRSADTTNCGLPFDRKRISRPLTGKHVRHGTGASPSTLVSLRNMIQQRQKLKEIGKFDSSRYGKGKGSKRVKRK